MNEPTVYRFDSRAALELSLSSRLKQLLSQQLESNRQVSIALSGGSTPVKLLRRLSNTELPWEKIDITLVDDRIVPVDHQDSNERMVHECLLQGKAKVSTFFSLCEQVDCSDGQPTLCSTEIPGIKWPLDIVVLGMGSDGHTASWFSDAPQLQRALTPVHGENLVITSPQHAPHQRVTLTLPAVLASGRIILMITGEEKMQVLNKALQSGKTESLPICAIIRQADTPLDIYWAP